LLLDNTQIKSDSESAKLAVGTEQPYTEVSAEEAAMEKPKKVKKEKAPKAAKEPKPVKEKKKKKEADATDLMNN